MRRIRVIPVLLLQNQKLVKTIRFKQANYVGDCINALKIFNEKGVDEVIVLDINAYKKRAPDVDYIKLLVSECFMPLAYGGGISNEEQVSELFSLGIEKVVLGAAAVQKPELIRTLANRYGSQSVVVAIDIKKNWLGRSKVFIDNGNFDTGKSPLMYAQEIEKLGAGEIVLQAIERDGTMIGYDIDLLKEICSKLTIPVVALGGAKNLSDFSEAVTEAGVSAVAAGSLFVYKGPHKAVLINYPSSRELRESLYNLL